MPGSVPVANTAVARHAGPTASVASRFAACAMPALPAPQRQRSTK